MSDTFRRLEVVTDQEAFDTLNRIVNGYTIDHPDSFIDNKEDTLRALEMAGVELGVPIEPQLDSQLSNVLKSAREVLVLLAGTVEGAKRVNGALDRLEDARIEPVTLALVMAGIVLVLETEVDVKISRQDGKTDFDISVSKKATDKSIINKIFSVFS